MSTDCSVSHVDGHGLSEHQVQQFVGLYETDKKRLYSFILALIADKAGADDIFQETSVVLWREFARFEIGTDFSKWANGIAYNRVREYRRKQQAYIGFDDDALQQLVGVVEQDASFEQQQHEQRWQFLQQCLQQLAPASRDIYQQFYVHNESAQTIAETTGRSIYAIRKAIHKLRKVLFDCVDQQRSEFDL